MKVLVTVFCYNEGIKIENTLRRFPKNRDYDLAVMNDGSTDDSLEYVKKFDGVEVISHETNKGAGASVRTVFNYALKNKYEVVVLVAGNDKDRPGKIPLLLRPIVDDGYDFVQGSRYLKGGRYGKMPFYRLLATKYIHPILFSVVSGKRITDSTNGFRAIRISILNDPKINLDQDWLDKYELEPYLFYKIIKLGYKVKEVPVTKIYPPKELGYTKMKPITGWWSILRPLIYLALGRKK